ncbi:nuclear transport factor 2 family protein [Caenibius sp. WL]|uniref:nuclear transport factor 2 family protein n=1 Tax=Caenibius sp. WL TaxID=2872646 RepID=UPI001C9905FD|nr:nuclear transport factor 2 family protein [Caenibius sp. WL]QZP07614.1 nuclear transport factor 2 family protein [Caenibius sp. WL]
MLKDVFLETYATIPASVDRTRIKQTVAAYLASYADNDITGRAALFADEVVAEEPVGTPPIEGLAALKAFWQGSRDAGWSVANRLKRIIVNGNEACIVFESDLAVPGQGAVSLEVFETLAFDQEGRILRLRAYNDESCLR